MVQFNSVQDSIFAPGKAHMRSTLSLRNFPSIGFETVTVFVWLTIALSCPFKEDCQALPFFPCLASPGSWWCDVLGFVPAGSVWSSSTLQIFCDTSHLWGNINRLLLTFWLAEAALLIGGLEPCIMWHKMDEVRWVSHVHKLKCYQALYLYRCRYILKSPVRWTHIHSGAWSHPLMHRCMNWLGLSWIFAAYKYIIYMSVMSWVECFTTWNDCW